MSRDEGELLTVQMPRAIGSLAVCPSVKPTGEPDALIGHVRFDERGWETERCRMAQATAPILDSTTTAMLTSRPHFCFRGYTCHGGGSYSPPILTLFGHAEIFRGQELS